MLGWEDPLVDNVHQIRKEENRLLTQKGRIRAFNIAYEIVGTLFVTSVIFIMVRNICSPKTRFWLQVHYTKGDIKVEDVFFTLSMLLIPRWTLSALFVVTVEIMSQTAVTCKRVDDFLKVPEPNSVCFQSVIETRGSAKIQCGNFGWYGQPADQKRALKTSLSRFASSVRHFYMFGLTLPLRNADWRRKEQKSKSLRN